LGLTAVPYAGALVALGGLGLTVLSSWMERRAARVAVVAMPRQC